MVHWVKKPTEVAQVYAKEWVQSPSPHLVKGGLPAQGGLRMGEGHRWTEAGAVDQAGLR